MKIKINNNRRILGIQEEFSTCFPQVRIEFYEKPSKPGGAPAKELVRSHSKTLAVCRAVTNEGAISLRPGMTVGEVKQNFRDVFGLSAEIFKKAGKNTAENTLAESDVLNG